MAKSSGIGDNLYIAGYDLSGDIGSISSIADRQTLLEVTGIDKGAVERIIGLGDGEMSFNAWFNDAAGSAHPVLSAMGSGDKVATYFRGTTVGNAMAGIVGKQVDYAPTRNADGSLDVAVSVMGSDGDGLRWGRMLTAGKQTDVAAGNGTTVDDGAASSFGCIAYLHVFAFTGTDVTISIEDSANGSAWAALSGAEFTEVTSGPTSERIRLANDATVRRYLRVVTAGTFDSVTFAVGVARRYAAD